MNADTAPGTALPNGVDHPEPALLQTYSGLPFILSRAAGELLYTEDGRELIDFYGGHCVCGTGHGHPVLRQALQEQLDKLVFYSTAARIRLRDQAAAALVAFAGEQMQAVFFCNSGSEANESALKLAIKQTGRTGLVAFHGSFHGRSLLALSVSDSSALRQPYSGLLAPTSFLTLNDREALAQADFSAVAAVIVEPVQSMAGVRGAEAAWLHDLRDKCSAAGSMLIFDEVQTGLGRLGRPFASHYFDVAPDMLTGAKSLASGFPMAALLVSASVASAVKTGDLGSTFGGGPLACAALLGTLQIIEQEKLAERASMAERFLRAALADEQWLELRGAGLLLGLEAGRHAPALKAQLLSDGLVVGGSNEPAVLRLMPPLNISQPALERLVTCIKSFARSNGLPKTAEAV